MRTPRKDLHSNPPPTVQMWQWPPNVSIALSKVQPSSTDGWKGQERMIRYDSLLADVFSWAHILPIVRLATQTTPWISVTTFSHVVSSPIIHAGSNVAIQWTGARMTVGASQASWNIIESGCDLSSTASEKTPSCVFSSLADLASLEQVFSRS